jgi:hypothetical protein
MYDAGSQDRTDHCGHAGAPGPTGGADGPCGG